MFGYILVLASLHRPIWLQAGKRVLKKLLPQSRHPPSAPRVHGSRVDDAARHRGMPHGILGCSRHCIRGHCILLEEKLAGWRSTALPWEIEMEIGDGESDESDESEETED